MDNHVMTILLIIFGSLVGVGILVTLIMKKCKAPENAMTVSILITCFFALIAAGISVFLVSVNMMQDYVSIRRYTDYTLTNEDNTQSLLIKEYSSHEKTGFEIYKADAPDKMLGELPTDSYLPFMTGEYTLTWQEDTVVITYTFRHTEDSYQAKQVTVSLKDGTVGESRDTDQNLSDAPNKEQSSEKKAA